MRDTERSLQPERHMYSPFFREVHTVNKRSQKGFKFEPWNTLLAEALCSVVWYTANSVC